MTNTNNNQINNELIGINICNAQSIRISNCGSTNAQCFGDTFIRLFDSNNVMVAADNDYCGLCSQITYNVPISSSCQTFTLSEGCYSTESCSGMLNLIFF